MRLSKLIPNTRLARVRQDLANPYEMHSTLAWAFAAAPAEGPKRILWRSEPMRQGEHPVIIVQSHDQPRWRVIEERFPGYLVDVGVKSYRLPDSLRNGQILRFRLRANPTVTRGGKRFGLRNPGQQTAWLERQGKRHGFAVLGCALSGSGLLRARRRKESRNPITVQVVTYDGYLSVEDSGLLRDAIVSGLGHAKALGLGLLSVAPARG